MLIRVGFNIVTSFTAFTPAVLMLYMHPSRKPVIKKPDCIVTNPAILLNEYTDSFGNRCARFSAPPGPLSFYNDALVEDSGNANFIDEDARQLDIEELPSDTLQYLLGSRYCEVDLMGDIAWELFGKVPQGRDRVRAVADWVHHNTRFDYKLARKTRTALETYKERVGVCRDFTHLALTFFRCLNIPARYATGYLGDIGVEPLPFPMDFSSWAEVYLSGTWYIVDPRHNIPRIGHVPMAYGRDALDVALFTSFGQSTMEKFEVWTYEVSE